MDTVLEAVKTIQAYLWNFPMLVLLLGTHIYFTFRLGIIQKRIPEGIRGSFAKTEGGTGNVSPYSALATALAATIGTGNIIGISTAIAVGGPGAVFWCWITGVFGIATCYAESFLSVKYRVKRQDGSYVGGPMYVLERVLHKKWAAWFFAIFAVLASFGIGSSVQAHSISAAVRGQVEVSSYHRNHNCITGRGGNHWWGKTDCEGLYLSGSGHEPFFSGRVLFYYHKKCFLSAGNLTGDSWFCVFFPFFSRRNYRNRCYDCYACWNFQRLIYQ